MMNLIIQASFLFASVASAAITAYFVARRGSAAHLSTRFTVLQEHFAWLKDTQQAQEAALMNLRSRVTMQATRDKRASRHQLTDSSPISPGDLKNDDDKARVRAELNAKLANGELKPIGR